MKVFYDNNLDIFELDIDNKKYYYNDYENTIGMNPMKSYVKPVKNRDYVFIKIIPSNKCNLECKYCFSRNDRKGEILDFNNIKGLLQKIKDENNKVVISFTGGGEPTTNFECIKKVAELFKGHDVTFSITTNGVFNKDFRDFLIEYKFNVAMSIDGDYNSALSEQSGKYTDITYNQALNNALELKKFGVEVTILTVITLETLMNNKNIQVDTLDYFYNLGLKMVGLTFDSSMLMKKLSQEQLDLVVESCKGVINWKRTHKDTSILQTLIYGDVNSYNENSMCPTVFSFKKGLTILPNGNLTFCHRVQNKEFQLSEYTDDGLTRFEKSTCMENIIRKVKEQKKICRSCISRQTCMSQICPALYVNFYDGNDDLKYFCKNHKYIRTRLLSYILTNK